METVKSCLFSKAGVKDGKEWRMFKIETESGLSGTSYGEMTAGQQVTSSEKEYKGEKQYTFFPVKDKKGGFAPKDPRAENRRAALSCSVAFLSGKDKVKNEHIIQLADIFFDWLQK